MGGTVSDGSFIATLDGDQTASSATHKAVAYEGQHILIIPGVLDPATGPFGVSYGSVKVLPTGFGMLAGSLADGTPISQTSTVSRDGYWPMYLNLYSGKGSLWGWNYFTNRTLVNATALSWINETNSSKTALYRAGFTNQSATLTGGLYIPSATLHGDLTTTLTGGNLPFTIMNGVVVSGNDKIALTNAAAEPNKLR